MVRAGVAMAEETNEGVSYLMALKRSAGTPAAKTETPGPDQGTAGLRTGENSAGEFKGAEKRRSARYKCEGSAEMRESGCDVHTWATFTDIGLHGCYLEAQATYPAGTMLQLKLEVNGHRVETKGEVRVCYPYLGMGVAFVDLSTENLAQLKRLLAAISRPAVIMGPGVNSPHPVSGPLEGVPEITDPAAAVRALVEFFETRHLMVREDFLRVLTKSQSAEIKAGKAAAP